jgi:hypothetical protein
VVSRLTRGLSLLPSIIQQFDSRDLLIWPGILTQLQSVCFVFQSYALRIPRNEQLTNLTNLTLRHEGVWGSGCINPHFLDLDNSWRSVVSFTPLPLYRRYTLDSRLGGPQSRSGQRGEKKILDSIGTRIPTLRSSSP